MKLALFDTSALDALSKNEHCVKTNPIAADWVLCVTDVVLDELNKGPDRKSRNLRYQTLFEYSRRCQNLRIFREPEDILQYEYTCWKNGTTPSKSQAALSSQELFGDFFQEFVGSPEKHEYFPRDFYLETKQKRKESKSNTKQMIHDVREEAGMYKEPPLATRSLNNEVYRNLLRRNIKLFAQKCSINPGANFESDMLSSSIRYPAWQGFTIAEIVYIDAILRTPSSIHVNDVMDLRAFGLHLFYADAYVTNDLFMRDTVAKQVVALANYNITICSLDSFMKSLASTS